jgi:hypothetical protein
LRTNFNTYTNGKIKRWQKGWWQERLLTKT